MAQIRGAGKKIPDTAFAKAFTLIFEKGTGVIEKTSKKSKGAGTKNLLLSGVSGVGMGVLGIGLPDIPVFTGMILKSIYETALHYGCGYDTKEDRRIMMRQTRLKRQREYFLRNCCI